MYSIDAHKKLRKKHPQDIIQISNATHEDAAYWKSVLKLSNYTIIPIYQMSYNCGKIKNFLIN